VGEIGTDHQRGFGVHQLCQCCCRLGAGLVVELSQRHRHQRPFAAAQRHLQQRQLHLHAVLAAARRRHVGKPRTRHQFTNRRGVQRRFAQRGTVTGLARGHADGIGHPDTMGKPQHHHAAHLRIRRQRLRARRGAGARIRIARMRHDDGKQPGIFLHFRLAQILFQFRPQPPGLRLVPRARQRRFHEDGIHVRLPFPDGIPFLPAV